MSIFIFMRLFSRTDYLLYNIQKHQLFWESREQMHTVYLIVLGLGYYGDSYIR